MKKFKLNISLILITGILILGMTSCDKKPDCCTIIDVDVQILYKNQSGENLINSHPDFEETNIKIYYKDGNDYKYAYNGNLDAPNMYRMDENTDGDLLLTIYPSYHYVDNQSTTLIELNPTVVDTLICEFELDSNREVLKKAWLNGMELNGRFIEVQK